jgi:hypothetical protein
LSIGNKIIDLKCGTQRKPCSSYVLRFRGSREFGYNRRIQMMALCQGHDGLMSWAMVDHDLEHAIKWRLFMYLKRYLIEHEKIRGWPRQRDNSGFKLVNSQSIKIVPCCIKWSCAHEKNEIKWCSPSRLRSICSR